VTTLLLITLVSVIPAQAQAQGTAVLLPLRGLGADNDARRVTLTSLKRRLEARRYAVITLTEGVPEPGAAASDLAAIARAQSARIVVDPVLQEFAGELSLMIRVVSSSGAVLGEHANLATVGTLPQDATRTLTTAMESVSAGPSAPPPETGVDAPWDLPDPVPTVEVQPPPQDPSPRVERAGTERPRPRPTSRRPRWRQRHWWLGGQIEPAMGTNRSSFNLLVGLRGEYQWHGLTVALNYQYAYIVDWEPRSNPDYHSMALYGMIGYQIRLGSDRLYLPLLAGAGFVPGNGAMVRIEAGLAIKPTDRIDIRAIFVCPNFWILGDGEMVLFTSLSLAVLVGF
jgi:hypothetical protein